MKYYKKLNLDHNIVAKKTLEYIKANRDKIKTSWTNFNFNDFVKEVPELLTLFKEINITPYRVALIVHRVSKENVHRDDTDVSARINIPILNCEGSQTKFWKTSAQPVQKFLSNGTSYLHIDEKECELVEILELDVPTAIRVKEPHSVSLGEKIPRLSLTVEFIEDIEYLLND